jgi:DNA-binding transcriptional ArsR family regulator
MNQTEQMSQKPLTSGFRSTILKYMLNYRSEAQLDLMFQALADPSRRLMVEQLCRGPASVTELAKPLSMSLPAVVQHLHVLEASGLVRTEKTGRVRTCRIEPVALRRAEQWIAERRTSWERRLDRLGDFLAENPQEAESEELDSGESKT